MTLVVSIAGGVLGLVGLLLVVWALFGDRSRTPRCRKCWYSMQGASGLQCPECGWTARHERVLTRPRRRLRIAAIGAIGLCGGGAAMTWQAWQVPWWDLMPTDALAIAYGLTGDDEVADQLRLRMTLSTSTSPPGPNSSAFGYAFRTAMREITTRGNSGSDHDLVFACIMLRPNDVRGEVLVAMDRGTEDDLARVNRLRKVHPCFMSTDGPDRDRYLELLERHVDESTIDAVEAVTWLRNVNLEQDELRHATLLRAAVEEMDLFDGPDGSFAQVQINQWTRDQVNAHIGAFMSAAQWLLEQVMTKQMSKEQEMRVRRLLASY